jgi:3-methyl-2-oxobutanoate hydroxymethyltransferase
MKCRGERITMTTAYDRDGGFFADRAGIDIILVGDTGAEMVHGHPSTVFATMDEQLLMTRSVSGVVQRALVVGDLPFGAYESSGEVAVRNAVRLVKEGGAGVVKLEGPRIEQVRAITGAGIGVMGHVGLTPQSETVLGGRKAQGRTAERALQLFEEALALEAAGCFAIVFEAVPEAVTSRITQSLRVPTIGIYAGRGCDGQVLVYHDLLGLLDASPPRARRYANLKVSIEGALAEAVADVRSRRR